MSKNLRVFKLTTGEEIIAEVVTVGQGEFSYNIRNALALMMQQTQKGFGVAVIPWGNHIAEPFITIYSEHIIFSGIPRKELVDMYDNATSPLDLPTKSLITG